jgi:hypothetical protein
MPWQCQQCKTSIEDDDFELCWNCNTKKGATEAAPTPAELGPDCLRCKAKLSFIGTKNFHEGTRWGVLGDIGEFFVNKENLDMYGCKSCGKVEFFMAGFIERPE